MLAAGGHRLIPITKTSERSFEDLVDLRLNKRLSKSREAGDWRRHRTHYDVTVMIYVWAQWSPSSSRVSVYFPVMFNVTFPVPL